MRPMDRSCELAHISQVPDRISFLFGITEPYRLRQSLDDLAAPALSVLVVQYVIAHLPVVEQHLRIGCTDEPDLRLLYFRADGIDESLETSFLYVVIVVAHCCMY